MAWTVERVLALAPDPASATAGRGLANAGKWQSAGLHGEAAWGEAKGSGAKPYQTVVSLGDGATKCSCPSRKFPCKHALGLLLRVAQGEVSEEEAPVWATEWLQKRGQKAAVRSETPRQADPKTAERRWGNVLLGLDECEAFLHDAVGNGLVATGSTRSWDEMAARMVDAQASGIARRLRRIGDTIGVGSGWAERAAADLGSLSLLVQAARNAEALGDLAHDVRAAVGLPVRKEDLAEVPGIADVWDVFGAVVENDERLTVYRTWLRGRDTGRWAMHLTFSVGGAAPLRPIPGIAFASHLKFFPSAWPVRAHFDEFVGGDFAPGPGSSWEEALQRYALALAENPWVDAFPVHLRRATLGLREAEWFAMDESGRGFPLRLADESRWPLLARTGNAPCDLFGEFDGHAFRALSAWGAWGIFLP